MRKSKLIKKAITFSIMVVALVGSYQLGKSQCRTKTVTETKTETVTVEKIPDGYIQLEESIPLEDIAFSWTDCETGYTCFILKDVGNQLDDPKNKSYEDIMKEVGISDYFNDRNASYTRLATK